VAIRARAQYAQRKGNLEVLHPVVSIIEPGPIDEDDRIKVTALPVEPITPTGEARISKPTDDAALKSQRRQARCRSRRSGSEQFSAQYTRAQRRSEPGTPVPRGNC